jgi:hypothetical protein
MQSVYLMMMMMMMLMMMFCPPTYLVSEMVSSRQVFQLKFGMHATRPVHLTFFDLIALISGGK